MPVSVDWYQNDTTIVQAVFAGHWTMEDFLEAVQQVETLIEQKAPNPVSVILNMEKSGGIPRGVNSIPHFRNVLTRLKYQYMVIAGGTSFGLTLTRIVIKILPEKNRSVFFEDDVAAAAARIISLRAATL